ncbi:MAG TPA: beta-glucosidase, partial [Thermotoga sp.]|nr:beta-glucosidase [Thermotoga sp.]
ERALREIYLKGFEIALKAKPWTVMSAYNKLNGIYCSQNKKILTDILREEWKFDGFVMTDWFAGDDPVEQMKAGNDLIMPGKVNQIKSEREDEVNEIIKAVKEGILDEKILDRNVKNILKIIVKTPSFKGYKYSNKPNLEKHAEIAYEAAVEGMVLLKNENETLPLSKKAKVALFGTAQIETIKGGTGSGDTHPKYVVSIVDGLIENGLQVDEELLRAYKDYIKTLRDKEEYKIRKGLFGQPIIPKLPEMDLIKDFPLDEVAERTEIGIIVLSRISGEGYDRKPEKGDFYLSNDEQELIEIVTKIYHSKNKKVVVILNIGGPIEVVSWRDKVDAILLAWQAGQEIGKAVADVLLGKVNPSGKLPTTFPKDYWDVPSSKNFPGDPPDDPEKVVYEEGIYVGYRYFDSFDVEPAYEFGYGLSYTTFCYENLKLKKDKDNIYVSFEIVNTGEIPGKEIAQVYVRMPNSNVERSFQELKGFVKTKLLNPGEREQITIRISIDSLSYFDEKMNKWILEKGVYEIRVGASSRDIKLLNYINVP